MGERTVLQKMGGCFYGREKAFGAHPEAEFIVGKAVCEIRDKDIQQILFGLIKIAGMHAG